MTESVADFLRRGGTITQVPPSATGIHPGRGWSSDYNIENKIHLMLFGDSWIWQWRDKDNLMYYDEGGAEDYEMVPHLPASRIAWAGTTGHPHQHLDYMQHPRKRLTSDQIDRQLLREQCESLWAIERTEQQWADDAAAEDLKVTKAREALEQYWETMRLKKYQEEIRKKSLEQQP